MGMQEVALDEAGAQVLDELALMTGKPRQGTSALVVSEVIRELTEDDLPLLRNPPPSALGETRQMTMRFAHHQLAQLLAQGTDAVDAALITGYSPAYISTLKHSPAFQELLQVYGAERALVFVDTVKRMQALGTMALEELQQRLADEPENWSKKELLDMAETLLVKGQSAGGVGKPGAPGGGGTNITVSFVTAGTNAADSSRLSGAVIEQETE